MKTQDLIVAVDFSEFSKAAIARGSMLAAHRGGRVHLLHSVPPIAYPAPAEFGVPPSVSEAMEARSAAKLEEWAGEVEASGVSVTHQVSRLPAVDAICEAAEARNAQLIVMGTHGYSGLKHAFLGSVAERTLRVAPCPVLTVKESPSVAATPIRRVLVCTDFSSHADCATELAISLCRDFDAELHLVHSLHPMVPVYAELPPPEQFFEDARNVAKRMLKKVQQRVKDAGLEGTANFVEGDPTHAIVDLTKRHGLDLVALGTRGNTGIKHVVLGSVAERVLRQVDCSVLTAKVEQERAEA